MIEQLKRKVAAAEDLQSIVTTMKVLAAANIRQYERAVQSLAQYNATVEMGLQVVLQHGPRDVIATRSVAGRGFGAVVFGSDQGLVGQFNEQMAGFAIDLMNGQHVRLAERSVVTVGARVTARLEEAHQSVERCYGVPGSLSGVTAVVQDVLAHVERWRLEREIDRIVLFHHRPLSGAAYRPQSVQLLPLDLDWLRSLRTTPWASRSLPTFTMEWSRLFSALVREYLFVALYRACAESLASENASRLMAMQAAERNIEERLRELRMQYQQERQASITSELLDIIGGFEALAEGDRGDR
jgi:F-type H+-transporting ATPase subunit gamma